MGASDWSLDRIKQANKYAEKSKQHGFSMSQIQCSLAACTPERWGDSSIVCMDKLTMQKYKSSQFPLYAYSAQAGGYYSILEKGEKQLSEDIRQKYDYEENRKRAEIIREIGKEGFSKNTFYRFLNSTKTNWLRFTSLLAADIVNNDIKGLTDDKRRNVFIIDDSLFDRSSCKKTELGSKDFDHTDMHFKKRGPDAYFKLE